MSGRIGPPVSLTASTPTPTNLDGVAAFLMVYNGATWEPYVPAGGGGGGPAANVNIVQGLQDSFGGGNIASAQPAINTPVAGATQVLEMDGYQGASFNLSGTWSGTVVADATSDDLFWSQALVAPMASYGLTAGAPSATAITANGNYVIVVPPGSSAVRLRAVTLVSGTLVTSLTASASGQSAYTTGTAALALEAGNLATLLTALQSIIRAEDSASTDADKGILDFMIQKAVPVDTAADGDYVARQGSGGAQWVRPGYGLPNLTASTVISGVSTGSGLSATNCVVLAVAGYSGVSFQAPAGTYTMLMEFSIDDGTTFPFNLNGQKLSSTTGFPEVPGTTVVATSQLANGGSYFATVPPGATHVRARCSAFTSAGTVIGRANLSNSVVELFNNAVTISGNPTVVLAASTTVIGKVQIAPGTTSHITTNATTTVKSGAGTLHAVVINTRSITGGIATVYDNTAGSGTVLAVIDTTLSTTAFIYDAAFATGLTVVTAGGVTPPDLTVVVW